METRLRSKVVAFRDKLKASGEKYEVVASGLGLSARTVRDWARQARRGELEARARGRPRREASVAARNEVAAFLGEHGPQVSLGTLRLWHPDIARRELECFLARYRALWSKRHPTLTHTLAWSLPGAVWSMDHVLVDEPIEGRYPAILSLRDLGSGRALLWMPVLDLSAEPVIEALAYLFTVNDPPLVIKSDNGSAFIDEALRDLLRASGVHPLFSPPRTPSYNGAVEAAGRWLKEATEASAARAGRPGLWKLEDFDRALALSRLRLGPEPSDLKDKVPSALRESFSAAVKRRLQEALQELSMPDTGPNSALDRRFVERIAVRRALVECGILTIRRRLVTAPIKSAKTA